MILVDDRLATRALAGQRNVIWQGQVPSVAWVFYTRLLATLQQNSSSSKVPWTRPGKITRLVTPAVLRFVNAPPPNVLQVVDPRPYAALAVELSLRKTPGMNKLAADFLAAAIHHQTPLHVVEGNVGVNWEALCESEGVELRVVPDS